MSGGILEARGGDGVRWRGREVSRLEGFSDAVFGFALTLLVVSLEVPRTFDQLVDDLKGFPAFAICFALFVWIWHQHHLYFRRYALQDAATVALNAVLLFVVLGYVYPLKFLFTILTWQATGLGPGAYARVPPIREEQAPQLMAVYGVGFAAVSLIFALLYVHAWSRRRKLDLDVLERFQTISSLVGNLLLAGVGLLSLVLTAAGAGTFWAGNAYWLIGPLLFAHGLLVGSRKRRLAAQLDAGSGAG